MVLTPLLALLVSLSLLPGATIGIGIGFLQAPPSFNCSCPASASASAPDTAPAFTSAYAQATPCGGPPGAKLGCGPVPSAESFVTSGDGVMGDLALLPLLLRPSLLALLRATLLLLAFLYASLAPGWRDWRWGGGLRRAAGTVGKRPWEVPFFGAMPAYLANFPGLYDYITDLLKDCPTLTYTTFVPGQQEVVTAHPRNIQHILKDNFHNYPKGPFFQECFHDFLGHGIFNSDGPEWVRQRKAASLVFSTNSLRNLMLTSMHQEAHGRLVPTLQQAVESGQAVDLQDVLLRYTFDNICRIGFGVDPGCLGPDFPDVPFAKAFDKTSSVTMLRNLLPGWVWKLMRWMDVGPERQLRHCNKMVKSFAKEVIEKRQREMAAARAKEQGDAPGEPCGASAEASDGAPGEPSGAPGEPSGAFGGARGAPGGPCGASAEASDAAVEEYASRLDLLSRMIWVDAQHDPARPQFSPHFLLEACTNFVLAGRDTSALALTWLFWLLGQHPEAEQRMLEEVLAVKAGRGAADQEAPFSFEELKGLTYVQAAINEGLRLYPSVPLDLKYAVEDDTLPDGTRLREGARVFYAIYSMGRMESVWGPDAAQFRPERWLTPEGCLRTESPFKFPAFNAGPRLCLGRDMAYLQMKSVITAILPRFRFLPTAAPVTYGVSLTLFVKNGLFVHVTPR